MDLTDASHPSAPHPRPFVVRLAGVTAVCCLVASGLAHGQGSGQASTDGRFLAMDLFGGTHPEASTSPLANPPSATFGWEIGSTVRFARWLGIAGGVGRVRTPERAWITHVQAGPRVSAALGPVSDLRGFAHVMVGRASSRLASGATASSPELMAGVGIDLFNVFRVQVDVVRRDLPTFSKTNGRLLFGVAIPLCFRGCTAVDGFAVSRQPTIAPHPR
jgi:hypothetical protein